ncbi:hypothetical protein [Methylophaga sp. OBS4]|uniref:hypothetical protein n=1 Tax=Methylophaga sp. OBS4 TaxID=2991935 RepID=UPI00224F3B4C|nr:hypothetical protein [Methylophaga sp. OBS4]MCX4186764.1 hypothetical protein [Methylophaga sp. OBS4]
MTKIVAPIKSFRRSDTRENVNPSSSPFECEDGYADDLIKNGLVRETRVAPVPEVKGNAAGNTSSASPAAQASPMQTSSESESGDTQKKKTGFLGRVFGKKEASS